MYGLLWPHQLSIEHGCLPMADGIILATAREYNATVWTQDSDFKNIPGVKIFPKEMTMSVASIDLLCMNHYKQFECKVTETQKGIQIDISAKDASKTESLKALAKACRDFCGCC